MGNIVEKYRKECYDGYLGNYNKEITMREAILESIFKPDEKFKIPGKEPMSHLHPDIGKLHLPPHVYIADWRKYRIEDHPMLVNFQKKCHAAGLHDPWLRNYCSQLYPNVWANRSILAFITNGCLTGLIVAAGIFAGEKVYDRYYPIDYEHSPEYMKKHGNHHAHH